MLALVLLGVGVLVGALAVPDLAARGTTESNAPTMLAVTAEEFADERQVSVRPRLGEAPDLVVLRSGRVTATQCRAGATLVSGQAALTVDGRGVLALATSVPLWRDLGAGTRGEDVRALQTELTRLGERVAVDGVMGRQTLAAARRVLERVGAGLVGGAVAHGDVVWLPAAETPVAACQVTTGESVTAGTSVATVTAPLEAVLLADLPRGLAEGDRVLVFGDSTTPVDATGTATDATFLTTVADSEEYATALVIAAATSSDPSLSMAYRLAEPAQIVRVPPAAVGQGPAGSCVVDDAGPRPVRVVGSQLGQSYVTPTDGGAPPSRVEVPAPGGSVACA